MSRADEYNTQGAWAVFGNFGGHLSMHAVGDESILSRGDDDMLTARKLLDQRSRSVLLPLLREVLQSGEAIVQTIEHKGRRFRADVRPLHSPDRSIVAGAIAVYDFEGSTLPTAPLIGCWQWTVAMDNTNYGDDASVWDDNLHLLHEYPRHHVTSGRGPAGEWLSKLVPPAEQFKVEDFVKKGLDACNNRPLVLNMGAVVRPDSDNPGRKQLELIGTAMPHPIHRDAKFAYGFTREVPKPAESRAVGYETVSTAEFVRAYFAVTRQLALVTLDLQVGATFQRSPGWSALGLHPDFVGDFASLVPDEDRAAVLQYFDVARRTPAESAGPHRTRVRVAGSRVLDVIITGARIDRDVHEARFLLLTVELA